MIRIDTVERRYTGLGLNRISRSFLPSLQHSKIKIFIDSGLIFTNFRKDQRDKADRKIKMQKQKHKTDYRSHTGHTTICAGLNIVAD